MPQGSQLARQWRLLQLLDRPQGVTVEDAAEALGCAVRTIWRDLRVLQDGGFPIYDEPAPDGRRGLWRVEDGFKAKLPLKLTLSEVAALVMSREFLAPLGASLPGPAVTTAFEKIRGVLSRDAVALLERMRETIGVRAVGAKLQLPCGRAPPDDPDGTPRAPHSADALLLVRARRGDGARRRSVPPHALQRRALSRRVLPPPRGVRVFAVELIRAVEVLRRRFEIPAGFDAKEYLDKASGREDGRVACSRAGCLGRSSQGGVERTALVNVASTG